MQGSDSQNWRTLWLGGFCAPGIYGAPIRAADGRPRPTLTQRLTLPSQPADRQSGYNVDKEYRQALERWSAVMGGRPVWIARSVAEARLQLLTSSGVASREPVLLPANATHPLVEAVKQVGATPSFAQLDQNLNLAFDEQHRIVWLEPLLGLPAQESISAEILVLDHGDSVPRLSDLRLPGAHQVSVDVELYGLHLSHVSSKAGALLVFNSEELYVQFLAQNEQIEPLFYRQAAEQLPRLAQMMPAQESALNFVWTGIREAAGLPLLPIAGGDALAHGVAVRIPDEGSPSLFWSYARQENTPIQWLPEIRPLHYAAMASHAANASVLERWLYVPVCAHEETEFLKQSVLGVVKTAEYLGLRWRTDPMRAAQYAAKLDEIYGPGHDAYRPAFATPTITGTEALFNLEDFLTQVCSPEIGATSLDVYVEH
jgi:hypothetical protein